MRVLAMLFGIILLLPGLCSLGFIALFVPQAVSHGGGGDVAGPFVLLWGVCFVISYCGILMIRYAVRGPAPPRSEQDPMA